MRIYLLLRLTSGLLATRVALHGLSGVSRTKLVIDTGAIYTVVHPSFVERIGTLATGEVRVRTLERTLRLPMFTVERISVFGATLNQYCILAYPPAAFTSGIDGVLSIDVPHSFNVRLDFSPGTLTIP